ncbi:hypothetical protein C8J57DRAFT_1487677 [Mycena rebaudengoi]|nr:hypothetical protein C8J57DRAFT_1487677 [Mycena rebaudengoi]
MPPSSSPTSFPWPPCPLLRPPTNLKKSKVTFEAVKCSWPHSPTTELADPPDLTALKTIWLNTDAIILVAHNKTFKNGKPTTQNVPFIYKQLAHLADDYPQVHGVKGTLVSLGKRANVLDDLAIDVTFVHHSVAAKFVATIKSSREKIKPRLTTCIYMMTSVEKKKKNKTDDPPTIEHVARLLHCPSLQGAVTSVLTALAYSESAQVLAPVTAWNVRPDPLRLRTKTENDVVQQRFQHFPPPLILVLDGAESMSTTGSPIPDIFSWDKESDALTTTPLIHLPRPPHWPGPDDAPLNWVHLPVSNYGIHQRETDTENLRFIALSHDLVQHFLAAGEVCEDPTNGQASMAAATAALKATIVHEIAHLYVTETSKHSPPRAAVEGAHDHAYDYAETNGIVEAGKLVEIAWLGRTFDLAIQQDGWLALAMPNDESLLDPPTMGSEEVEVPGLGSPFRLAADSDCPPPSPTILPPLGSPFHLDSKSSDSPPPSRTILPPLGSPFHLDSKTSDSPPPSPTITEIIDRTVGVQLCDPLLLNSFLHQDLPLFRNRLYNNGSPTPSVTYRKDTVHKFRSIGSPMALTPPSPQPSAARVPPTLLTASSTKKMAYTRAQAKKWPKVSAPNTGVADSTMK